MVSACRWSGWADSSRHPPGPELYAAHRGGSPEARPEKERGPAGRGGSRLPALFGALDDDGDTLSATDAHSLQSELDAAPLHLVKHRRHDAGAGGAHRMAQRYAGAVDVRSVKVALGEAPLSRDGQHLCSERLVQLDEVHILQGAAGALQRLLRRRHRAPAP